MDRDQLVLLTKSLLDGQLGADDFVSKVFQMRGGIADVGEAQVDIDRRRRCGFSEVVFAEGKSVEAIAKIFGALLSHGAEPLATRLAPEQAEVLLKQFPTARYNNVARTMRVGKCEKYEKCERCQGRVVVVTGGTSDLPVAEEARETALWTGADVDLIQDVGVAGPHRLEAHLSRLQAADAVVVAAGMEGALPSVVGGHVACPVIAVPTSVGYGASFGGVAALLGMLNSCASNVAVVNIDAGFKGGYVAGLIAKNAARARQYGSRPSI